MAIPVYALIGALLAIPTRALATKLVRDRQGEPCESRVLSGTYSAEAWVFVCALGWALIAAANQTAGVVRLIQFVCVFEILLCLSAVDLVTRRIPNELLAALLLVFIAGEAAGGSGVQGLKSKLLGALVAAVVFVLPSKAGMDIGWGDIKYATVIGLGLGIVGFLQVTAVMALALGAYAVYLYASRRGTVKSFAAIGPYLSLGVMSTLVFPVLQTVLH
ncbi:MAG TPA: prepilin peptidase [Feifaniaceae bacterium]|nr:prepilin peptidase [Feifaniaceae bacterium]